MIMFKDNVRFLLKIARLLVSIEGRNHKALL